MTLIHFKNVMMLETTTEWVFSPKYLWATRLKKRVSFRRNEVYHKKITWCIFEVFCSLRKARMMHGLVVVGLNKYQLTNLRKQLYYEVFVLSRCLKFGHFPWECKYKKMCYLEACQCSRVAIPSIDQLTKALPLFNMHCMCDPCRKPDGVSFARLQL